MTWKLKSRWSQFLCQSCHRDLCKCACSRIDGVSGTISCITISIDFVYRVPELLVLNDCDIDKAGEPEDLRKNCCSVKELDLAQNKLQNWTEVFTILAHMPRVEFVNLSLNRLLGPVQPPIECGMGHIRSLVLNNTRLDWESVETIIKLLPALEELHLSLNDYKNVLIDTIDDDVFSDETTEEEEAEASTSEEEGCSCNNGDAVADNAGGGTKRSNTSGLEIF